MSATPTALIVAPRVAPGRAPFLRAVRDAVTWKMLLAAQLIGLCMSLTRYLERRGADLATMGYLHGQRGYPASAFFNSHFISMTLGALIIPLAAVAADEALRRGAGMWRTFALALLAASGATAVLQWCVRAWLGVDYVPGSGLSITRLLLAALDVSVLGGLAMLAYLNRQMVQRMLEGVRTAELERVQVERCLIESRLAATQAQIDPAEVLAQLAEIRNLYGAARAGADERLETLMQELRASVARGAAAGPSREAAA